MRRRHIPRLGGSLRFTWPLLWDQLPGTPLPFLCPFDIPVLAYTTQTRAFAPGFWCRLLPFLGLPDHLLLVSIEFGLRLLFMRNRRLLAFMLPGKVIVGGGPVLSAKSRHPLGIEQVNTVPSGVPAQAAGRSRRSGGGHRPP